MPRKRTRGNLIIEVPFLVIVLNSQFLTDVEVIMETVVVLVNNPKTTIGRGDFQHIQQMPLGTAKVVGLSVENDAIGNKVKMIISSTNTLITRLQQVCVLVHLTQTESTVNTDYKLGKRHSLM